MVAKPVCDSARVRICVVYDCLFPHTVGGAERWYRNLAERLAAEGHDVTYLTMRQWAGDELDSPGASRSKPVAPRLGLYTRGGRRRIGPPLVFGAGVLAHLLVRGRRYDVVHTASFPYFSLLAAGLTRRWGGFHVVADWHEVWSREYWREYLGRVGSIGGWVQATCARLRQDAFCFSRLHAARLREIGGPEAVVLEGEYEGELAPLVPEPADPVAVFAGRHIPEKRVPALVPAIAAARPMIPNLRCDVYGDGPDREAVERLVAEADLGDVVRRPWVRARARALPPPSGVRSAWSSRPGARGTAWSSSKPQPRGPRAWSCRAPTMLRQSSSRTA